MSRLELSSVLCRAITPSVVLFITQHCLKLKTNSMIFSYFVFDIFRINYYNQLQKYLRHCTVFWHRWPVHDLVLVIPPPPLIKVASNTRPYSKLGGTTLNGREEGGQYYILQTCDQERFEARKVVFPWECLIIFATGCSFIYERENYFIHANKAYFAVLLESLSFMYMYIGNGKRDMHSS